MAEKIVLDPSEVADSDRTEIDLTCWIDQEGVDWGDAEITPYMSEARYGEVPVDYRVPNRQIQMPLILRADGGTTMSEVRAVLQRKAALYQAEGGWIKRTTDSGGTVYADVVDAKFHATSWSGALSRGSIDLDATLSLSCLPDWYGNEVTLPDHVTTATGELQFSETNILGDYPARMRMVIDNDQATGQQSLFYGFRPRYEDTDLVYEAEDALNTAVGGTVVSQAGAYGGTIVRRLAPATFDSLVIDSWDVKGTYRVFGRFYSAASVNADIEARLAWGPTLTDYVVNQPVTIPGGTIFSIAELGAVRGVNHPVGTSFFFSWCQVKGVGGPSVAIDRFWLVPADEYAGVVRNSGNVLAASSSAELRTTGFYFNAGAGVYVERPVYGDLPRLPFSPDGQVQVIVKTSRGMIGDVTTTPTSDAAINDDLSVQIFYRPSYLFLP